MTDPGREPGDGARVGPGGSRREPLRSPAGGALGSVRVIADTALRGVCCLTGTWLPSDGGHVCFGVDSRARDSAVAVVDTSAGSGDGGGLGPVTNESAVPWLLRVRIESRNRLKPGAHGSCLSSQLLRRWRPVDCSSKPACSSPSNSSNNHKKPDVELWLKAERANPERRGTGTVPRPLVQAPVPAYTLEHTHRLNHHGQMNLDKFVDTIHWEKVFSTDCKRTLNMKNNHFDTYPTPHTKDSAAKWLMAKCKIELTEDYR
ncbi:uncharacterized protein LOC122103701 [Dipodomys spectabilis]|uniref:uncharacterized protein LOC122103701 n=1 Tax=Dipodomys spectabilis TaxID=105255 RepID=UPI001C544A58|nr:uncharacterized protein LOC122103701 [Dipodomys spectabilis]